MQEREHRKLENINNTKISTMRATSSKRSLIRAARNQASALMELEGIFDEHGGGEEREEYGEGSLKLRSSMLEALERSSGEGRAAGGGGGGVEAAVEIKKKPKKKRKKKTTKTVKSKTEAPFGDILKSLDNFF